MATRPAAPRSVVAAAVVLLAAGCSEDGFISDAGHDPSVAVQAVGCLGAAAEHGRGYVAEPGLVVTVAHVVAGATDVEVNGQPAEVVAFDAMRDVAVLRVDALAVAPAETIEPVEGDRGTLLGTEPIPFVVQRRIRIETTDIYRDVASERDGLELSVAASEGDSGGPLVDSQGRVGGVLFATALANPDAAFAVRLTEVEAVIGGELDATVPTGRCV